jgi:ATP-dependent Clp protease ATP-binding subunit ClpC
MEYLSWHYGRGLKNFLVIWKNFFKFFWNFFSIKLLFKTLFNHWRRDVVKKTPGFDIDEILFTLASNIVSRAVGFIIRLLTLTIGLVFELLTLYVGVFLFFVWLVYPVLVLGLFLKAFTQPVFFLVALLLGLVAWFFYSYSQSKLPSEMTLEEMMKQDWFEMVWKRAGINPRVGKATPLADLPKFLKDNDLSQEDFAEIVAWVSREQEAAEKSRMFWTEENLSAIRGIGKDWSYGYTGTLDKFSVDLCAYNPRKFKSYLIGRGPQIDIIQRILARAEGNNVLIVGEAGTGRKTIVRGFADFVSQGKVLPPLKHKRVLDLDVGDLLSGSLNLSEMEARLRNALNEANIAGNIILVIDDFQNFVGGSSADSGQTGLNKIDISGVLTPYLVSKSIQLICITTYEGLHKNIEANPGLMKYFEKLEIKEPEEKESLLIVENIVPELESRLNVLVGYRALKEIISKSEQYFSDVPMPERAIDFLDESLVYLATKTSDRLLEVKHVDQILSEKTEVPIGEVSNSEKEKLAGLEELLHQRVINQEEAVKSVAAAMRRARLSVGEKKKPIGSFLFLGPTGVGKTETARALSLSYFGREDRMVRLDMTEYQNISDVARMIGSQGGEPGYLTTQIRENPFSLLLLDEIEKAHPNILNLFLQVLDEGWLTDAWGRKVNFRNTIIIATSNAAAEVIRQMVKAGANPAVEKESVLDYLQKNALFRPEFLNRFDDVVVFHPLTKDNLLKIAELFLKSLSKRMAEQKMTITFTSSLVEKVAELGYTPEYGARPMKRVIQDRVENLITKKILDGELASGGSLEIRGKDI